MADFCAGCTGDVMLHDVPDDNDFLGWLGGQVGYGWALCEGCGLHLLNDRGQRKCKVANAPAMGLCKSCELAEKAGTVLVVEPRKRPRCCNCNAKLGFAIVSGLSEVGATLAPSVRFEDGRECCLLCYYPF
jgi:hypothetical protein